MSRLIHLGLFSFVVLAALIGRQLTPAVAGLGTHQQLGLPPCPLFALTGWPCPTCGMTTSLVYLLQGEWQAGWNAHPLGPVVALLLCCLGLAGLYGIWRPVAWQRVVQHRAFTLGTMAGTMLLLGVWIMRLWRL